MPCHALPSPAQSSQETAGPAAARRGLIHARLVLLESRHKGCWETESPSNTRTGSMSITWLAWPGVGEGMPVSSHAPADRSAHPPPVNLRRLAPSNQQAPHQPLTARSLSTAQLPAPTAQSPKARAHVAWTNSHQGPIGIGIGIGIGDTSGMLLHTTRVLAARFSVAAGLAVHGHRRSVPRSVFPTIRWSPPLGCE
ncbi:hypothetical protein S7711_11186 [Stachybotrys chartarum IBT 7711]|uniref:Uncharacterized protein n=1 Tax=Stachybotrys chartarum (strain CBS 109288 / IBT 7711) TaxID=1280523 RepID=A0A084AKW9_STACB|nr:hypothetical protein S7711_11186 [Stachybotrys chartarum IBT 7711]